MKNAHEHHVSKFRLGTHEGDRAIIDLQNLRYAIIPDGCSTRTTISGEVFVIPDRPDADQELEWFPISPEAIITTETLEPHDRRYLQ